MRVAILGGSGFIGRALCEALLKRGDEPVVVSRRPDASGAGRIRVWDAKSPEALAEILSGLDAAVNLAGANLADERWTPAYKDRIIQSRVGATDALAKALSALAPESRPTVVLQGSALGFYGHSEHTPFDESHPAGTGFLAETAKRWESAAAPIAGLGVRLCLVRTGVVLGKGGGMLQKMLPAFKNFLGGTPGSGKQGLSWIHLADQVGGMLHLLDREASSGPFNFTAPNPSTMKEFCKALAKRLGRPLLFPIPAAAVRLAMGEAADELVLNGAKVYPERLLAAGYVFRFPTLDAALADLLD